MGTSCSGRTDGAFRTHARKYFDIGLSVIPAGGPDGKKPLITAYHKRRLGPDEIDALAKKYPSANIAIVTGLSNLAVVDVDDPTEAALKQAIQRFGASPVIVRTGGRGGFQIYYKTLPGLRPHNFRHSEDRPMELRSDGNIVVAPPSTNPITLRTYEFMSGTIEDIADLPKIDTTTMPHLHQREVNAGRRRSISLGQRNDWLFRICLRAAHDVDDVDALLDVARTRAEECFDEMLTDKEIENIARSAWGYHERGANWTGRSTRYPLTMEELGELESLGSDAAILALHLRLQHGGRMNRGEAFALDTRAMEQAGTIKGWSRAQFRKAITTLRTANILRVTHNGRGRGDPSRYQIAMYRAGAAAMK